MPEITDRDRLDGMCRAIEEVWAVHAQLSEAKTIGSQAQYIIELSNRVSDLASWHPRWDYEHGEITGVFEDV